MDNDYDSRDTQISRRESYNVVTIQPRQSGSYRRSTQGAGRENYSESDVQAGPSGRSRSTRISRRDSYDNHDVVTIQPGPSRRSRSTRGSRHEPSAPSGYIIPQRASSLDRRRVTGDLERIRYHSRSQRAPQYVRNYMTEMHEIAPRTEIHPGLNQGTGGAANTSRRYRNRTLAHQEVHYHGNVEDEGQRVGNLVHELTHASIGERFDRDYVSYTNPPRGQVEEARFNSTNHRMTNENDRQTQQRVPRADNAIRVQLEDLQRLTHEDNSLTREQKQYVIERLSYGIREAHVEFDTIINQIATQFHYWGVTSATSRVARQIERLATRQHRERMSGNRIVASTIRRPTYRPGMRTPEEKKPSFWSSLFGRR